MSDESEQDHFQRCQDKAILSDDLTDYQDKWIAVRSGEIVASGFSLAEVRSRDDVQPSDLVMPVPRLAGRYLILGAICETISRPAPIAQLDRATPS